MMKNVTTRFLECSERLISVKDNTLPFVVEPASSEFSTIEFLQGFLAEYSEEIADKIAHHGAILFRGFAIDTTEKFEQSVLSIKGMQGMGQLFMSEPGRDLVDGLKYVFHTNSKVKTGGALHLGGFHNENYYSPDVPAYISFCCFHPAKLGGETGLIHMGKVYEALTDTVQNTLEQKTFFVSKWPLPVIANRYKLSFDAVKTACSDFGLTIEEDKFVVMHKPSVFLHPKTGKKIIQANLCHELQGLNHKLVKFFIKDYRGLSWLVHKMAWKYIGHDRLKKLSFMLPAFFRAPMTFLKMQKQMRQRIKQYTAQAHARINNAFTETDVDKIAAAMRDNYASFLWKKGDLLIVDNLQIAHAGMPGKTDKTLSRKIRAMLCNPIKMPYSAEHAGLQAIDNIVPKTLGEMMYDYEKI